VAAFVANRSDAVRELEGGLAAREHQGLVVLAALVVLTVLAAVLQRWAIGRPQRTWPVVPARRLAALAVVAALVLVPVVTALAGSGGGDEAGFGATTSRLGSASSNRADYWRVAWQAAGEEPLRGLGPGGFGPVWLRERPYPEAVKDAHSLPLETLTELGLVGLVLLLALVGSVAIGARDALRADAALAAGPAAVVATWFVHAAIDWDWEMPALTLIAVACVGLLLSDAATRSRAG
jgi:O-antigen ligase